MATEHAQGQQPRFAPGGLLGALRITIHAIPELFDVAQPPYGFPLGGRVVALVGIPEQQAVGTRVVVRQRSFPIFTGRHVPRHDVHVELAGCVSRQSRVVLGVDLAE